MIRTKEQWFEWNGFNEDGITYVILGNTFNNKDYIKENGGKFNREIKWHAPNKFNLPEDCKFFEVKFTDAYSWDATYGNAYFKSEYAAVIEKWEAEMAPPSLSEFYGEIGVRFRDVKATYLASASFNSAYGQKFCHKFSIGNDLISWFTTKYLEIEPNTSVLLSGTPKEHQVFRYENVTICNRCIVRLEKMTNNLKEGE